MTKNYAVIENDKVLNVIVADSLEIAKAITNKECIECDGSFWIGWTFDGTTFEPPVEEEVISD